MQCPEQRPAVGSSKSLSKNELTIYKKISQRSIEAAKSLERAKLQDTYQINLQAKNQQTTHTTPQKKEESSWWCEADDLQSDLAEAFVAADKKFDQSFEQPATYPFTDISPETQTQTMLQIDAEPFMREQSPPFYNQTILEER